MIRKVLVGLLIVLIIIQFIRPAKNQFQGIAPNDITASYVVPDEVKVILKKACNDCHSNNTVYPWYSTIQPVAWWLNDHVKEGKGKMNFNEFSSYTPKRQRKKLEEVIETVKEGEMPLDSYTWIHKEARLTTAEKLTLSTWADTLSKSIALKYSLPVETEKEKEK